MVTPRVILPEVFSPSNGMFFCVGFTSIYKSFSSFMSLLTVGIVSLVLLVKNLEISDIEL
jgi:hypothetical protein